MPDAPPPRWSAPGFDSVLTSALELAKRFSQGGPAALDALPKGHVLVKARPMRAVIEANVEGPRGVERAYFKMHRAATSFDRARNAARSPRGAAEGSLLRALLAKGVSAAEPLGWGADPAGGGDVLVVRAVPIARSLADACRAAPSRGERLAIAAAVGRLLRAAHDAGWRPRDVHRDNVMLTADGPVLIDPGTGRLRGVPIGARRALLLGIAAHGLAPGPRAGWAAMLAYAGGDRAEARRMFLLAAEAERAVARTYRRGRSRRAHRTGLHFETFRPAGSTSHGILARGLLPEAWKALAADWIRAHPAGARPLKAGGSVAAVALAEFGGTVVVKRFEASWKDRFRTPRAIRAFRTAYALKVRGIACPEPLGAAADGSGAGVYVAEFLGAGDRPAYDLASATSGSRDEPSPFARLEPAARRAALDRLGRFLRHLHDREVVHRDLKAPNLVAWTAGKTFAFAVVDLEGVRVARGRVRWSRRARDLARLDASLGSPPITRTDRMRVLRGYFAAWERARMALPDFARLVAYESARKRAPSGKPR